jgi:TolB-like protein
MARRARLFASLFTLFFATTLGAQVVGADIARLTKALLGRLPPAEDSERLAAAVLKFEATSKEARDGEVDRLVTDLVVTELEKSGRLTILDRKNTSTMLKEIGLSESGVVDGKALEAGKILAAEIFVSGSVHVLSGNYVVTATLTRVETGKVVASEKLEISRKKLDSYATLLYQERRYPVTSMFRSLVVPGWGQFQNDQPVKGALFLTGTLGTMAAAVILHYQGDQAWNEYLAYTSWEVGGLTAARVAEYRTNAVAQRQRSSDMHLAGNVCFFVGIGLWSVNLFDALIVAALQNNRLKKAREQLSATAYLTPDGGGLQFAYRF